MPDPVRFLVRLLGRLREPPAAVKPIALTQLQWTMVTITLAGIAMLLAAGSVIALLAGALLTVVTAVNCGRAVGLRLARAGRNPTLFAIMLAWLPAAAGLALAVAGLALIAWNPGNDPLRLFGIALFLVQIALVAVLDAVPEPDARPSHRSA